MARPTRTNAEYFYHPASFRNDRRVKAIRARLGMAGYGLLLMLIEVLTDANNTELAPDEIEMELLAGDLGVDVTEIETLLQLAEKIGLFARSADGWLRCPQLDEWLVPVFEKRNRARNTALAAKSDVTVTETPVTVTVIPPVENSTGRNRKERSDDGPREASPAPVLSQSLQARLATLPDTTGEVPAEHGPLGKSGYFRTLCDRLQLGPIDHDHYRQMALMLAADTPKRTSKQWESWVAKFFTNQKQGGPLLLQAAQLAGPTPQEQLPLPGHEAPGQLIVINGIGSDASMNRIKLDSARQRWPTATIHVLIPGQRHD